MKIPVTIHESWYRSLQPHFQDSSTVTFLKRNILPSHIFFPPTEDIFNVFKMPIHKIKLVILGQDPYPNTGQAIGYAFAIDKNTSKPPSLRIIEKELGHTLSNELTEWRKQGVFLLNTALTVKAKTAGSHLMYWKEFTKSVINEISRVNPCSWLLMGKHAQSFELYIQEEGNIIYKTPHPAAETYAGGKAGFYGSNVFKKINNSLLINL